jgi:hypothetical protein
MANTYTNIFGGGQISPAQGSYISYTLTALTQLAWPQETAPNSNLVANIVEISAATGGAYGVILPSALLIGVGQAVMVNNLSAYPQVVQSFGGTQIANIPAGQLWFFYLQNNTTSAGAWFTFQYGSATSIAQASALAGNGLVAKGAYLNQAIPVTTVVTNYSAQTTDLAKLINAGTGTGTITLLSAASANAYAAGWYVQVRNSTGSVVTLQCSGSDTINGGVAGGSITLNNADSCIVVTDGTSWYTIGLGTVQPSFFNYQQFSVTGLSSPLIVGQSSAPGVNKIAYNFIGVLTANMILDVPAYPQTYWVTNNTTGAFTFTVQVGASSPAGTTVVVARGTSVILYCDGTNVTNAVSSSGLSNPVTLAQGGTGVAAASTAAALGGLGASSIGISIVQAASAQVVQTSAAAPSVADAFIWSLIH